MVDTLIEMGAFIPSLIVLGIVGLFILVLLASKLKTRSPKITDNRNEKDKGEEEGLKKKSILGEGTLPCYVIKLIGEFVYTTIKDPVGNAFIADASMSSIGQVGPCYLVREVSEEEIRPYDPREETFKAETSPQHAYFATHWDIVREVYRAVRPWWQSAPLWVAMAVLGVVFIGILVLGGG